MTDDQKINEMLEENHICAYCGGVTRETFVTDDERDEIYDVTVCNDCGGEQ